MCGRQDSMYECLTEVESEEYGCDEGVQGQCRWLGLATAKARCMSWPRCEAIMGDVGDDWWYARGVFNNSIDSVAECNDGMATRRHYEKLLPQHAARRGVGQPAAACRSLQAALDDEWCDMNCQLMPDAASCKGYCVCPPVGAAAAKPKSAPPKSAPSRPAARAAHEKGGGKGAGRGAASKASPPKEPPKRTSETSTKPREGTPSRPFAPWAEKAAMEKAAAKEAAATGESKGSSRKARAAPEPEP